MPVGTVVHNVELQPGRGGQMARSAGASAQLMAKDGDMATLRLPSGEMRLVRAECRATVGTIGNAEHQNVKVGKAGRKRHMGVRPQTRGVAMNPVDHPHGGGEGSTTAGRHPVTPWGVPTLGYRTRKQNKTSNRYIVRGRRRGKGKEMSPLSGAAMSRSSKKGPWVEERLMAPHRSAERREQQKNAAHLVARVDDLPGDGRPHDRRPRRQETRPGVHQRVDGRTQARRVRAHARVPRSRRLGQGQMSADDEQPDERSRGRARRGHCADERRAAAAANPPRNRPRQQSRAAAEADSRSRRREPSRRGRGAARRGRGRAGRREGAAQRARRRADGADRPTRRTRERANPRRRKLAAKRPPRSRRARSRKARRPARRAARGKRRRKGPARRVVRAHARYVRTSARKARMVCGHLRGKSIQEARAILAFTPREVARDWSKLLESAVANAESNHELLEDDLIVREAYADEGPTIKRFRPRAMGRATPIRKRTSHLTITLTSAPRARHDQQDTAERLRNGTEGSSRGHARGLHPRLEVELVQREQLRRVPRRGRPRARAHHRQARPRRPL